MKSAISRWLVASVSVLCACTPLNEIPDNHGADAGDMGPASDRSAEVGATETGAPSDGRDVSATDAETEVGGQADAGADVAPDVGPDVGQRSDCTGQTDNTRICIAGNVYACQGGVPTTDPLMNCGGQRPLCWGGACVACTPTAQRACAGAKGACAGGVETCTMAGDWGACSVQPQAHDTCDPGNDATCNGRANEDCACLNGTEGSCADKLGAKGTCAGGVSVCQNGHWAACSVSPAQDSCVMGNDDSCNGVPNEGCLCDGFVMPNPATSGLPNPAKYNTTTPGVVSDEVTGLIWDRTPSAATYTRAEGADYCAANRLAGRTDWRLPTRLELVSLVDFMHVNPSIDESAFPGTPGEGFWTADDGPDSTAWYVVFYAGYAATKPPSTKFTVRCVTRDRANAQCYQGPSRFKVQGNLVYDASTRLTWQRDIDPRALNWNDATAYCAGLGQGYRLPSIKELESIVDGTRANPAIDPAAFPGSPPEAFWSSSPVGGAPTSAWELRFVSGSPLDHDRSALDRVRCVR